ncbi:MAG: MATE family efflux transporter [Planctomycetaceae bacterium]|nr:MATE family efflux transporter [Planctomycetaceae bacterium]
MQNERQNLAPGYFLDGKQLGLLLQIALPLIISTGFFSLQLFIDRTLLFAYSSDSAAAAMSAGTAFWTMICFPTGLIGYVYVFVAQYYGAKREERIGVAVWQAFWLTLCITPFFVIGWWLMPKLFIFSEHPENIIGLETSYFRWMIWAAPSTVLTAAMAGFFSGLGKTTVVMATDILCTLINVVLSIVLVFGIGPFPEMGIDGAALATVISSWVHIPILGIAMFRPKNLSQYGLLSWGWDRELIWRMIRYGWPAGVQMLSEAGAFFIIMLKVGKLGELPAAATTLALGVNILAFVPMMGLSQALGVLVGQHLTEGKVELAVRTVRTCLLISAIYTTGFALVYWFFPDQVLAIYSMTAKVEQFSMIEPLVKPLLVFIAIYCILDGFQIVFVGAIKGAGDTFYVLMGTMLTSAAAIAFGIIGGQIWGESLNWWWIVITLWVIAMMIAFGIRYWLGYWKKMRVIEG